MEKRFNNLVQTVKETGCDVLGVNELLYKYHASRFDELKDGLIDQMETRFEFNIPRDNNPRFAAINQPLCSKNRAPAGNPPAGARRVPQPAV